VDQRDDARAQELNNLRLALATFAVQLDAFEMHMSETARGHQPDRGPVAASHRRR